MICLALASGTNGSVKKGDVEIEALGGWAMESGEGQGDDQSSILEGATGGDLDGWFASAGIGWFTSKNFEIGIAGFGSSMDGSERITLVPNLAFPDVLAVYELDVDAMVYGGGGRGKWHFFPNKTLVPYVGVQVFWATADVDLSGTADLLVEGEVDPDSHVEIDENESDSGILWGPIVGLRVQLAEKLDALVEYQYHMWSGSIGDFLDNGHMISAGLCLQLK